MDSAGPMRDEEDRERLQREIEDLKRDLAALTKTLTNKGVQLLDDLEGDEDGSTFEAIKNGGRRAARVVGHQAQKIGGIQTQNSVSTLMVIAGLGIAIGMLAR
ncbi:hypothetical protein [Phyllobacterium sp. OV277]|uniref:hypothetical protein n=1 Tax=Phyllobacterium sp. OV277 TaxID=1882772 RepID=UPI000881C961|nr:hypothetical protein [Phyllobacterium sp. OV277]SDP64689.1 hypothetical protein SAMN05443582_107100 [Phyllobacterium sp. OV277]